MRQTITLAAVLLILGAWGCGGKSDFPDSSKVNLTNDELERSVRVQLSSDSEIYAAQLSIEADAEIYQVTLSGILKSELLRDRALRLARSAQPGLAVIDNLKVEQPQIKPNVKPIRLKSRTGANYPILA
jgi:hypothetical protein